MKRSYRKYSCYFKSSSDCFIRYCWINAIQASNYVPFIPEHKVTATGDFGGWQGIYAGVSMIFLAYIGFDSIANSSY